MARYRVNYHQTSDLSIEFDAPSAEAAREMFETSTWPSDADITDYGVQGGDVIDNVEYIEEDILRGDR